MGCTYPNYVCIYKHLRNCLEIILIYLVDASLVSNENNPNEFSMLSFQQNRSKNTAW